MLQYLKLLGEWQFKAVFLLFGYYFPAGRKSLKSDVVSPSSGMVIVVRVVFTYCKTEKLLSLGLLSLAPEKKCENYSLVSCWAN